MKGFVNINKPQNMTSSDVVVVVRGILRRVTGIRYKVGHFGTLDPMGTGVLPIAVGKATRLFDYSTEKIKIYQATFLFGVETDTLDSTGTELNVDIDCDVKKEKIMQVIPSLIGDIDQMPPLYSAKSVNGKRAYEYARAGKEVELKTKNISIESINLIGEPKQSIIINNKEIVLSKNEFAFEVRCSGGTYIRSIARDMANILGTIGIMSSIHRIKSGNFEIEEACNIELFEKNPLENIIDVEMFLRDYEVFSIPEMVREKCLNGVKIEFSNLPDKVFIVKDGETIVGLGKSENGCLKIITRL